MAKHKSYDPEKVKELRMSLVEAALSVMREERKVKKWGSYKKELILKMAPRIIPQLMAGRDDDEQLFPNPILAGKTKNGLPRNNSNSEVAETEKENS